MVPTYSLPGGGIDDFKTIRRELLNCSLIPSVELQEIEFGRGVFDGITVSCEINTHNADLSRFSDTVRTRKIYLTEMLQEHA
jgi:hypothetical protein